MSFAGQKLQFRCEATAPTQQQAKNAAEHTKRTVDVLTFNPWIVDAPQTRRSLTRGVFQCGIRQRLERFDRSEIWPIPIKPSLGRCFSNVDLAHGSNRLSMKSKQLETASFRVVPLHPLPD